MANEIVIVPSTKLKIVNVHKIEDKMTCDRLYFWRWVMNLVPKVLNMAFWYGSVTHKGFELLGQQKSLKAIDKAMELESKKYLKGYSLDDTTKVECDVRLEISKIMIAVYNEMCQEEVQRVKLIGAEERFRVKLKESPILFVGTVDAYGTERKTITLREYKTASRINNEYFARLKFDKQVNGYALGLHSLTGKYPGKCIYTVFRKPSIYVRQNETVPDFLSRLNDDLHVRSEWYFITQDILFGKQSLEAVRKDIEWSTFDLYSKFGYLNTEQLMDPYNWPRHDGACFNYGVCPYFLLCKNCSNYKLYTQFYKMRDIRYEEEQSELNKKAAYTNAAKRAPGMDSWPTGDSD